jgi:uncharacterized protein (DUF736 family)
METKVNSGAIFKNDKKLENHPDYRGTINVDGQDKEIALWVKQSAKGVSYFFVKISEPYKKPEQNEGREALKKTIIHESNFDNDDLPF